MKLSRLWSMSILIALALLLSAARNGNSIENAALPTPRNKQQRQPTKQPNPTPSSTPSPAATQTLTPSPIGTPQNQPRKDESSHAYEWFWPPIWSNWALVIAATVAAIVGLRTLDAISRSNRIAIRVARATKVASTATKQYVQMTTQMVEAAKQSAHAAELALNAERPYVFAEDQKLSSKPSDSLPTLLGGTETPSNKTDITISFTVVNRGKGVAVVHSIETSIYLVPGIGGTKFRPSWIGKDSRPSLGFSILVSGPPGEQHNTFGISIANDIWQQITDWHLGLIVTAKLRYRDVFKRKYTTNIRFEYRPPTKAVVLKDLELPAFGAYLVVDDLHTRYT